MIELPLSNGNFEDGWLEWNGIHELKVANGWQPWWHRNDTRPEFKIATPDVDPRRIHEGQAAQQWFNNHATHTAGIYQIVHDVPVGATLHFLAWVQAFSSNVDDFTKSAGRYRMRIGINPYGGMDAESPDVVWSEVLQPYDAFERLEMSAVARSDRCTVFVWGQAEWALKHNNAYVDACHLYYEADETPPEPPPGEGVTADQARAIARRELADAFSQLADILLE